MIVFRKNKKKLFNILVANQIIFNNFDTLDGIEKFEAYSQFCDNTINALEIIGGIKSIAEAQKYIFGDKE